MKLKPFSEISDEYGNKIIRNYLVMFIQLKAERRRRRVGTIDIKGRVLIVHRNKKKHLHRKSNSYGFNFEILSKAKSFDKIMLTDDNGTYLMDRMEMVKNGKFLFFKQQGFEKQIFIPIKYIYEHKLN